MFRKLLVDFIRIIKTILPVKVYQKLLAPVVSEGYAMYCKMTLASSVIKGRPSTGPSFVLIGPIANCNFRCYFCHTHSYCIPDGKFSDAKNERYYRGFFEDKSNLVMRLDMYKSLIDDLAKLKVLSIDLSGIGEPLLHPDIVEMVSYANAKNISCGITTNGSLLNANIIDELLQAGLKSMTISINSLNSESYKITHGIHNDKTLVRLKESISYLDGKKEDSAKLCNCSFILHQ